MLEDLSKRAKIALENALKKAEEVAKANPEIIEAIKGGAQLVADKKGENKGVIENAKEDLKDKSVNIIQEALNNISPLKIDIQGSITEKSIVIDEDSLNKYVKEIIPEIEGLRDIVIEDINIKIWNDNLIFITGKARKDLIKVSFSQKLKLEQFTMNSKEGLVRFSLIGEPDIQGKGFISHVALFITRMILMSVVNKKLVGIMNENNFELKENKLIIDLKNGAAKKLYEMDINSALGKNIPVIGTQKVIDLIKIKEVTTKDKKIMIDLGFGIG